MQRSTRLMALTEASASGRVAAIASKPEWHCGFATQGIDAMQVLMTTKNPQQRSTWHSEALYYVLHEAQGGSRSPATWPTFTSLHMPTGVALKTEPRVSTQHL